LFISNLAFKIERIVSILKTSTFHCNNIILPKVNKGSFMDA
jgi:hypothetical protein